MSKNTSSNTPGPVHDGFAKWLLTPPEASAGLFRAHLPTEITALMAPEPPERVAGSFVDEELASHQSDLLYKVQLNTGKQAFVYTLLEHKSAPDYAVHLQLQRYMNRIWQRLATGNDWRPLPVILPVVLYHGLVRWHVPLDFTGLFQDVPDEWQPHIPAVRYHLIDLSRIPDEELSHDLRLRIGLRVMKHIQRNDFLASLETVLSELHRLEALDVTAILNYIIRKWQQKIDRPVIEGIKRLLPPERKEEIMGSVVQEWIAKGEARGIEKGIEKGIAEGEAKLLLRQLERRFGNLPGNLKTRLMGATADELDLWGERVLDAPDLAAVFATSSKASH